MSNPYASRLSYLNAEKKLGFGSGDAPKRDEYSNFIAIEQYREQIAATTKAAKIAKDRIAKEQPESAAVPEALSDGNADGDDEDFLFDRVFKVNHDSMVGKAQNKHKKMNLGPYRPTTSLYGMGCDNVSQASGNTGRKAPKFYDQTHLHVGGEE